MAVAEPWVLHNDGNRGYGGNERSIQRQRERSIRRQRNHTEKRSNGVYQKRCVRFPFASVSPLLCVIPLPPSSPLRSSADRIVEDFNRVPDCPLAAETGGGGAQLQRA